MNLTHFNFFFKFIRLNDPVMYEIFSLKLKPREFECVYLTHFYGFVKGHEYMVQW